MQKTEESVRNRVVELKKMGLGRSKIHKALRSEGHGIANTTLNNILREAGLTDPNRAPMRYRGTGSAPSWKPGTLNPSQPASGGHEPIPISSGDGVTDFMPTETKKAAASTKPAAAAPKVREVNHAQCDHCGTMFTYTDESEVPDNCPECGS